MWACPKCERQIRSAGQWHNCVRIDMGSLFENKAPILQLVFDRLLADVIDLPDVAVSATQNCIVFLHRRTFLIVRPMKKQLDLKFYLPTHRDEPPIHSSIPYAGKFETHIRLQTLEDLNETVLRLIKISYDLLG